jgi:hypothetical protein
MKNKFMKICLSAIAILIELNLQAETPDSIVAVKTNKI